VREKENERGGVVRSRGVIQTHQQGTPFFKNQNQLRQFNRHRCQS